VYPQHLSADTGTEAGFDLIDFYSEAGVAHADLPSSLHERKDNPKGNENLPLAACQPISLVGDCLLLYQDRSPAQSLARNEGPGG
jgi:hypothetical protein